MILECQRNSYLKEFDGTVVSCTASGDVFNVILNDTILFPEGGGQPSDRGTLNGTPIIGMGKQNGQAMHIVTSEMLTGQQVRIAVDWNRRFDHMQQHTGQHLLTAMIEARFGHRTTSWNLGTETCYIELDTQKFYEWESYESEINEKIREGAPVTVEYFSPGDQALEKVKTRLEIPEAELSTIRVVNIEGVDCNTCCGTHVSNLSHLQAIKLLYTEKGKKGKTNLHFVVGGRVLNFLGNCVARERAMNTLLKCNPTEHQEMIEKLQKSLKLSQKRALLANRELALLEAQRFKALEPQPKYHSFHKSDAEIEFLTIFLNEANSKDVTFFLTVGDLKGQGQVLLIGNEDVLALVPRLCEIMEAKGVTKNGRFQGRVNKLNQRPEIERLIKEILVI